MPIFQRESRNTLRLIVGLGNPGKQHEKSRHNVGFMVADRWASRHHIEVDRRRAWAHVGEGEASFDGLKLRVMVAKPRTFMNLSGEGVLEMFQRHHVALANLLVVYDDMDLPLGKIRIREKGSAGGHNGIANIIERLGSQDFPRLRVGIGRPEDTQKGAIGHVLGGFRPSEREVMDQAITRACDAIDAILAKGMAAAMNVYNRDVETPGDEPGG